MGQSDHWGGCTPDTPNTRCDVGDYKEDTLVTFGEENMIIYEPCNYASNIAFYHAAIRACNYNWTIDESKVTAVKRNMATMGAGSSFWHGSHTFVGYSFDNQMISAIAYLAHQSIVDNLGGDSSILKELSDTPRNLTSAQVSE